MSQSTALPDFINSLTSGQQMLLLGIVTLLIMIFLEARLKYERT